MTTDHPKVGRYAYSVEPYTEDALGFMSMGFLGNEILRSAGKHATSHGFGYEQLSSRQLVWVLSRLVLQFDDRPRTGDAYTISTWVSSVYRQFTERLFQIDAADGRLLAQGFSIWAAINMQTRQAIDLSAFGDEFHGAVLPTPEFPVRGTARIRVGATEPAAVRKAAFCDLDINGHVNSMRYLEMVLDLFPLDLFASKKLRRLELQYCNESREGDLLQLFCDDKGGGVFDVEIRHDSVTAVRCRLEFA